MAALGDPHDALRSTEDFIIVRKGRIERAKRVGEKEKESVQQDVRGCGSETSAADVGGVVARDMRHETRCGMKDET